MDNMNKAVALKSPFIPIFSTWYFLYGINDHSFSLPGLLHSTSLIQHASGKYLSVDRLKRLLLSLPLWTLDQKSTDYKLNKIIYHTLLMPLHDVSIVPVYNSWRRPLKRWTSTLCYWYWCFRFKTET